MLRFAVAGVLLSALGLAQQAIHNIMFEPGAQISVVDWNGRLALMIVSQGSGVCTCLEPRQARYAWRLEVAAAALVDTHPCAAGQARYDLSFNNHWPTRSGTPTISPAGIWWGAFGCPNLEAQSGYNVAWFCWSNCNPVRCFPDNCNTWLAWNAVIAYPVLQ